MEDIPAMPDAYDLIGIGRGRGGDVGAIRAAELGVRVALVEREKVGGTCLHIGCIPTKAMLHTAELLEHLKDPRELGLTVDSVAVDLVAVQRRKARVVDQLYKGVQSLMRKNKIDVFIGERRFLSTTKIGAALADGSETELTGKHLLVATGSAPRTVPGIAFDHTRIIDSTDALNLEAVPRSIAILGAGPVGVEFASLFRAFGSEVTVIELLPTLVPLEDEEIGQALERAFSRRGIKVLTQATAKAAEIGDNRVKITVGRGDQTSPLEADHLLGAVGRAPGTEGLAGAEGGIGLGKGGGERGGEVRAPGGPALGHRGRLPGTGAVPPAPRG